MTAVLSYEQFVDAASHELRASGARSILPDGGNASLPEWTSPWRAILLSDAPGAAALSAFTSGDFHTSAQLQHNLDALVSGLADAGVFRGSPIALHVVTVFSHDRTGMSMEAAKLVPRAFITGLRPKSYGVDLHSGKVVGGKKSSLRSVLEETVRGNTEINALTLAERQEASRSRTRQFYDLVQGRTPVATYGLVMLNVAVFAFMVWSGGNGEISTVLHGGPVTDTTVRSWGAESPVLIEHGQWWRLASDMFLHGSLTHIVFNMASLLAIGTLAERLYGWRRYLIIYFGAGIAGSVASFGFAVWNNHLDVLGVGASGAIFGVAGALVTIRFQRSDVIPAVVRRSISSSMLPLVVISFFLATITQYVDNSAHVGGLVGGALLSFLFPVSKSSTGSLSTLRAPTP